MKLSTDKIILGDTTSQSRSKYLLELVKTETGQDIRLCYQCGKCSAGCPTSYTMELTPRKIMRAVQFGLKEEILSSSAIWLCLSCQTCTARCPKGIDIAKVMEALRHMVLTEKEEPAEREVALFNSIFLNVISMFGRAYEFGMAGLYNLRSGHLFANVDMLPAMLSKGKLALVPPKTKGVKQTKKIFERVKIIGSESH